MKLDLIFDQRSLIASETRLRLFIVSAEAHKSGLRLIEPSLEICYRILALFDLCQEREAIFLGRRTSCLHSGQLGQRRAEGRLQRGDLGCEVTVLLCQPRKGSLPL